MGTDYFVFSAACCSSGFLSSEVLSCQVIYQLAGALSLCVKALRLRRICAWSGGGWGDDMMFLEMLKLWNCSQGLGEGDSVLFGCISLLMWKKYNCTCSSVLQWQCLSCSQVGWRSHLQAGNCKISRFKMTEQVWCSTCGTACHTRLYKCFCPEALRMAMT